MTKDSSSREALNIRDALEYGALCSEGVTRGGFYEPCDKTAVALRIDPTEGAPYAVCAYHSRADMVPLTALVAALSGGVS